MRRSRRSPRSPAPARRSSASRSIATRPRPRSRKSATGSHRLGVTVPLVGDFHYIGHQLLADHPACAEALDKYRINPGNVGFKEKKDRQFGAIVETAIRHGKAVRIGANWGSLDQALLTASDGPERRRRAPARGPRRHARGDGPVGAPLGRPRGGDRPSAGPHHPLRQGLGACRISSPSTGNSPAAPTTPSISA